jgi:leader peptidase (prepilin peptidase) / N-methyltransferase
VTATEQDALPSLTPNFVVVGAASSATALLSLIFLPWPIGVASTILGTLMIVGADVDARVFLLPNAVTYGATVCGVVLAPVIDSADPWMSSGAACLRAAGTALLLALLRKAYSSLRGEEGLGFGDVKLAAAVGAWLPVEAISYCFTLATTAALLSLLVRRRQDGLCRLRLPFGAFLCPALWLSFFITSLLR